MATLYAEISIIGRKSANQYLRPLQTGQIYFQIILFRITRLCLLQNMFFVKKRGFAIFDLNGLNHEIHFSLHDSTSSCTYSEFPNLPLSPNIYIVEDISSPKKVMGGWSSKNDPLLTFGRFYHMFFVATSMYFSKMQIFLHF